MGVLSGVIALAFRVLLTTMDTFRTAMIVWAHGISFGWVIPILFTMTGAVIAVAITRRFAPEASGSGIPHLEAVLRKFRTLNWKRVLPVKFVAGIIGIGGGLVLGREGPTVQMGGAVGDAVSRWLKVPPRERLTLISSGAGAGLAAAFNAPLSGLIFVMEEVRRDFEPIVFGAAFIAAVISDIIARIGSNQFPIFTVPSYPIQSLLTLPVFAILGLIAGVFGVLYNHGLLATVNLASRIPVKWILPTAGMVGGIIGLVGWFSPSVIGAGNRMVETALQGNLIISTALVFFGARFLMNIASYGTGAPGGIFTPLLVMGSLGGLAIGEVAHLIAPAAAPIPAVFAAVGMAAFFTAIVRAPLTGIMLILEMTGNYSQMLPLLVSCFCAYAVAEGLKDTPIYEALLERDLRKGGDAALLSEPVIMEFLIHAGAPFAGQLIRQLGLPPGCIIVRLADGHHDWVPHANTRLEANMRITAVIAPEASEGAELLRKGTSAQSAE